MFEKILNWIVYFLTTGFIRIFFPIFLNIKIEGIENVPVGHRVILVPTHKSWLDIPLLILLSKRKFTYVAKQELWGKWYVSWWLNAVGAIPVDRDNPKPSFIKKSVESLSKRELLVIFPEGTRNKTSKLGELNKGVAVVATNRNNYMCLLVPIVISYSGRNVTVKCLKPFYASKKGNRRDRIELTVRLLKESLSSSY